MANDPHLEAVQALIDTALFYQGKERLRYLMGMREAIHMCCDLNGHNPREKLGDHPTVGAFAQWIEDQIDAVQQGG